MLSIFDSMMQHTHERVCLATDLLSGLRAVIAMHNTVRGPVYRWCSHVAVRQ